MVGSSDAKMSTSVSAKYSKASEKWNDSTSWWIVFSTVVVIAFATRFYKIAEPDHVCWDETHFGKMGSWYINGSFFFDVHPPLGKMLIGFAGKLTGYNGTFPFGKPGDKYGDHNYIGMRAFCAFLGASIVPFSFIIVWELVGSITAAVLAACLITFDIGLLTLSQYILLDPILMFFVVGSFMGCAKFMNLTNAPFTFSWYFWLSWTGVFMGCALSVKFVGLFVVLLIGLVTVVQLWDILGECAIPFSVFLKHFATRFICLILVPCALYMAFFWIHFRVLYRTGSGDGFFSSAFQSQLVGNSLYNASMPKWVVYGSVVTLKNRRTGGGYLHSHWHLYPEGAGPRQQQVTAYSHKDENNKWMIKKYDKEPNIETDPIEIVKNGDLIRLEHVVTTRNLHSHKEPAPVTRKHYQVSCYGENGTGDANDVWRIIIPGGKEREAVKTISSKIRLVHFFVNCALYSHSKQLPKWGYEQMEVTCNPNLQDKNTVWNVEENVHDRLPNITFDVYAPSFFEKFFESHAVMFQGNAGLKPKEGEVTSRPWQWPLNYRGQFFSGNHYKVYLLGNPIIWWSNLAFLLLYIFIQLIISIRRQRGIEESKLIEKCNNNLTHGGSWLFLGWCLHYMPFFVMGRVLYFHHYFPAVIFNSLLSAIVVDYLITLVHHYTSSRFLFNLYHLIFGIILSTIMYSFYEFSPLSYGVEPVNNQTKISHLKWLESWEF